MHPFDQDIAVTQKGHLRFKGCVSDNWSVNGNPDGGYLMALLANAILKASPKKSTAILTANFVSRCQIGGAHLVVEKVGRSKNFDRWQASLSQEGEERVRALGTLVDPKRTQNEVRYERSAPFLIPVDKCVQFPAMPNYTLFDGVDVRLEPDCTGWLTGRPAEKSEIRGWIQFKDRRPFDQLSILLMIDAFPPPILASHGMVAWVPTIELSVNIRSVPVTNWLKCVFRSRYVNDGMVEEDGEVWDENNALVAISRQISQFRKQE